MSSAFEVKLNKSGRIVPVAAGMSILDALLNVGVDVSFSCQQGICGTCETRVISGEPDHRDFFLSDAERASNAVIMVCCSRSKQPLLVLDL